MDFAVISLVVFVCSPVIGDQFKVNTGLLSIGCAVILGHLVGMSDRERKLSADGFSMFH